MRPIPDWKREALADAGRPHGLTAEEVNAAKSMQMGLSEYAGYKRAKTPADVADLKREDEIREQVRLELLLERERKRVAKEPADTIGAYEPAPVAEYNDEPRGLTADEAQMAKRLQMDPDEYLAYRTVTTPQDHLDALGRPRR